MRYTANIGNITRKYAYRTRISSVYNKHAMFSRSTLNQSHLYANNLQQRHDLRQNDADMTDAVLCICKSRAYTNKHISLRNDFHRVKDTSQTRILTLIVINQRST